ncbi:hypothetical protein [Streptomyces sp. ICBB 8177]|nr:hypothetical protein [Streptomyces sp. ICBB 8177]
MRIEILTHAGGDGGDSLPGQPWQPPQEPPSPDGGSPEGDGKHRR